MRILILIAILINSPVWARGKGNEGGGGGNVCTIGKTTRLLEFAEGSERVSTPGIQLATAGLADFLGLEEQNIVDGRLRDSVEAVLKLWEPQHPLLVELLRDSVGKLKFYVTPYVPKKSFAADFSRSKFCGPANTRASVVYQKFGAMVSVPLFNALDLESQTGVILHEAGRVVQLEYSPKGPSNIDLQELIRILLWEAPSRRISQLGFMRNLELFNWADKLENYCRELKTSTALAQQPQEIAAELLRTCATGAADVENDILVRGNDSEVLSGRFIKTHEAFVNSLEQFSLHRPLFEIFLSAARMAKSSISYGRLIGDIEDINWDFSLGIGLERVRYLVEKNPLLKDSDKAEIERMTETYKVKIRHAVENLALIPLRKE